MHDRIDVKWLDDVIQALDDIGVEDTALAGASVTYHNDQTYTLVARQLAHGAALCIEMPLNCERCGQNPRTVYLHSGLHRGAWCYAYDESGHYVANLRDQDYVCDDCAPPASGPACATERG